jgi:hypothetical protein
MSDRPTSDRLRAEGFDIEALLDVGEYERQRENYEASLARQGGKPKGSTKAILMGTEAHLLMRREVLAEHGTTVTAPTPCGGAKARTR